MAGSAILVVGLLAGATGVVRAGPSWSTITANSSDIWAGETVYFDATVVGTAVPVDSQWVEVFGTTPDDTGQECAIFQDGLHPAVGSWEHWVGTGMLNQAWQAVTNGWKPASGTLTMDFRCYARTMAQVEAMPTYADAYESGVTVVFHAGAKWTQMWTNGGEVLRTTPFEIGATTPVDTDQLCAVYQDGDVAFSGSWAQFDAMGIWNTTGVLDDFNHLAAPQTGSTVYAIRCYPTTSTAAGGVAPAYAAAYRSGVVVTAYGPTWAQLSVYVNDLWDPYGYQVDVSTGDYLHMDSTTPSDTDQQCAQFVNGMLAASLSWSSIATEGLWNTPLLAEEHGMIPSSGTFVFDIRCYARTMAEANGAEPAYDDPYDSGIQVTGHADSSTSSTGADTFQPASSRPTVVITSVPDQPFQPAYTDSSFGQGPGGGVWSDAGSDYEVSVSVAEANGASDVATVQLCLYAGGHDSECDATEPDPRYALVLGWTRPGDATLGGSGFDGFAKVGDNNARLNGEATGSVSTWADEVCTGGACTSDAFHTNLHFWFDVSDAMAAGTGWYARAIATNSSGQSNSGTNADPDQDVVLTAGVAYFGWVTTARMALDYGTLDASASSTRTGSLGTFIANGASSLFLAAEDFAYAGTFGEATLPLATGEVAASVESGTVALDCAYGGELTGPDTVRVGTEPVRIASDLFGAGTGEDGDGTRVNTCRLTYGGGAPISKVSYNAMVWVGIGPSEGLPFAGALPGSESLYIPR